jgi:hypothetical protein
MPHGFWAETVSCAVYLLNIVNISPATGKSAFETIYKVPPNLKNLQVFGAPCYVLDTSPTNSKWHPKAFYGRMVGYTERVDGYRIWIPQLHKLLTSKNVKFLSGKVAQEKISAKDAEFMNDSLLDTLDIEPSEGSEEHLPGPSRDYNLMPASQFSDQSNSESDTEEAESPPSSSMHLRNRATLKKPKRFEIQLNEMIVPSHSQTETTP